MKKRKITNDKRFDKIYLPSQKEIKAECAKIRKQWDKLEEIRRRAYNPDTSVCYEPRTIFVGNVRLR